MKNIIGMILLITVSTIMFSCDKLSKVTGGDVALVKGGTLDIDKSLTVGQAVDNYKFFKKVKWEAIKTDNGKRLVQVNADIDTSKSPCINSEKTPAIKSLQMQFQFQINTDNTFQLAWCGVAIEKTDGTKVEPDQNAQMHRCLYSLKGIYDNNPDGLIGINLLSLWMLAPELFDSSGRRLSP